MMTRKFGAQLCYTPMPVRHGSASQCNLDLVKQTLRDQCDRGQDLLWPVFNGCRLSSCTRKWLPDLPRGQTRATKLKLVLVSCRFPEILEDRPLVAHFCGNDPEARPLCNRATWELF